MSKPVTITMKFACNSDFVTTMSAPRSLPPCKPVGRLNISLNITLEQEGQTAATEVKAFLDLTLAEMEKTYLPDSIAVAEPETVKNPLA